MPLKVTVGGITPSFGCAMFAFRGAAPDVAIDDLLRAARPFVGLLFDGIAVVGGGPRLAACPPSSPRSRKSSPPR